MSQLSFNFRIYLRMIRGGSLSCFLARLGAKDLAHFGTWRNKVATALAFVAVSIAYEVNQWDENFYQKLNVPRSASNADIRKVSSDSAQLKYID